MKTIKLLLLLFVIVLFLGCSKDDVTEDCECVKYHFEIEWVVNSTGTGMMQQHNNTDRYDVGCEDEVTRADFDGLSYYNIRCK